MSQLPRNGEQIPARTSGILVKAEHFSYRASCIASQEQPIVDVDSHLRMKKGSRYMTTNSQTNDDEVTRLQARVIELEDELARRQLHARVDELEATLRSPETRPRMTPRASTGHASDKSSDQIRDASYLAADITVRAVRGVTLASLALLRSTADLVTSFVDDVFEYNRPKAQDSAWDMTRRLPGDVYSGSINAINRATYIPGEVIDTFNKSNREARSSSNRIEPRVQATTPVKGASGMAPTSVAVIFDRDIRPAGQDFTPSILVKRGSTPVAGTVTTSGGNTIIWTPSSPLVAGNYTITIFHIESSLESGGVPMRRPYIFTFSSHAAQA